MVVAAQEDTSKLVIIGLPGRREWRPESKIAQRRVRVPLAKRIFILRFCAKGVPWSGRPAGKIAAWLKQEMNKVTEDDKAVFLVFTKG